MTWPFRISRPLLALLAAVAFTFPALAQEPAAAPTVRLDFEFKGRSPERFTLAAANDGTLTYESKDKDPAADPYQTTVRLSQATTERIFSLAKETGFFKGDFEFHSGTRLADMGIKKFTYSDGTQKQSTAFNHTQNPALQQLWDLMWQISVTLEYIPRIQFKRRFDKLGVEQELRNMEYDAKNGNLTELNLAVPVLKQVRADSAAMKVVRERAERLIELAAGNGSASTAVQK